MQPKANVLWGNWQLSAAVEVLAETAAAEIKAKLDDFGMTAGLTEILECSYKTLMVKEWHQEHCRRCSCCHQHFLLCVVYMLVKVTNIFVIHVTERFIQGVLFNRWGEINRCPHIDVWVRWCRGIMHSLPICVESCLSACLASVYPYLKLLLEWNDLIIDTQSKSCHKVRDDRCPHPKPVKGTALLQCPICASLLTCS